MSYEEEFDKTLRQKVEEAEYVFDQANWEKASRMIDANRLPVAAATGGIKTGLLLLLGTVALMSLLYVNEVTISKDNFVALSSESKNNQSISTTSESINAVSQARELTSSDKEIIADQINTEPTALAKGESGKGTEVSSKVIGTRETKNFKVIEKNSKTDTKIVSHGYIATNNKLVQSINKNAADSKPLENNTTEPKSENTGSDDLTQSSGNNGNITKANVTNSEQNDNEPANAETTGQNSFNNPASLAEKEIEQFENMSLIKSLLPQENTEPEAALTFSPLKFYDDYYSKHAKRKIHYLNLEAGTRYLNGWDSPSGKDAEGFNWFGGINYGLYLSRKINLSIGLQAYNVSGIKQPFYESNEKEYNFGSTKSSTMITTNSLYYGAIPFKINYSINKHHQFGLGFTAAYLVDSRSTVHYSASGDYAKSAPATLTQQKGVFDGVNRMNYNLCASYRLRITKRIGLSAEYVFGLSDIFVNNSSVKNNEQTKGFSLSLQFTLFDK